MTNLDINNVDKKDSPIYFRIQRIKYLYRFFLLKIEISKAEQEILDEFQLQNLSEEQIKILIDLIKKVDDLVKLIEPLLSTSWKWNRITDIKKAILINGAYEILYMEIPKPLVINEAMNISNLYSPNEDNKFIHGCLDKIGKVGDQ